jgi:GMP synthase-like glutamine amidotransferase
LVCAWSDADIGLVRPVVEEAACAVDVTFREDGYTAGGFDAATHAGLIILGDGQKHSDDEECYGREMDWVRAAIDRGRAVLGICHGAQLLSHVRGGKLRYGKTLADKGLTRVMLMPEGLQDPVLRHAVGYQVAQGHYDTFTVPDGAVALASSTNEARPHPEAFRIGVNVYGLQFHPEPTTAMLFRDKWCRCRPSANEAASAEAAGRKMLEVWVGIAWRTGSR